MFFNLVCDGLNRKVDELCRPNDGYYNKSG